MADSGPLNGNGGVFNWRIEALTTLIKQGPAWALLTLAGIGTGYLIDKHVPSLVSQAQSGFERNRESLSRDADKMAASCERIAKSNEAVFSAMQQSMASIEKLHVADQKLMQAALDEFRRRNANANGNGGGQE